jgi:exonuclease III
MDMRFRTWNVRRLYRAGSLTTAARKLARYASTLDLVGVQEVRLDKRGHSRSRGLQSFLWKRKRESLIGNRIFLHQRIASAVKRVQFVSDRMSHTSIVLRDHWCNSIVLNVHAPSEEKSDDSKDRYCKELEQVSFIIFLSTI